MSSYNPHTYTKAREEFRASTRERKKASVVPGPDLRGHGIQVHPSEPWSSSNQSVAACGWKTVGEGLQQLLLKYAEGV